MSKPVPFSASMFVTAMLPAMALAIEIDGVGNAALDQPKVNMRLSYNGTALSQDIGDLGDLFDGLGFDFPLDMFGLSPTNIQAYYDTGAGVGLVGGLTAQNFGVPLQPGAAFTDVGIGGAEAFNLSQPLLIEIASTSPSFNPAAPNAYTHAFSNAIAAVGEAPPPSPLTDPFEQVIELLTNATADFNVLGMPYFDNKVVVMDARSLNDFAASGTLGLTLPQLHTHVYDAGNQPAFNPANLDNPGVPSPADADLTISLNFADFSPLTGTTGPGATPPNLAHNPMVGGLLPPQFNETVDDRDDDPGVTITMGAASSEGAWLFDTGAAPTIISLEQANAVGVRYEPGSEPSESGPVKLEFLDGTDVPAADQFELQIGGVGGTLTIAGFFLDSLTIPTASGEPLTFVNAPVLVADISILDTTTPDPNDVYILDGVLGMNYFFATTYIDGVIDLAGAGELATIPGAFDFVVYDETNNLVHLYYSSAIPEPAALATAAVMGTLLVRRSRRAA